MTTLPVYPTAVFAEGGYRYIPAVFQYSGGVAAEPGYRIERARFLKPPSLDKGFDAVEAHLKSIRRPIAAFCACELRSPAPFTEDGFTAFNKIYIKRLEAWGVMRGGVNTVARTNVCPEIGKPAEVLLHAFSYTVPADGDVRKSFVVAGSGEAPEGKGNYRDHTIRLGDRSAEGLRAKADYVIGEMEKRMRSLGFGWADGTDTHVYTVYDIHPFLADLLVKRRAHKESFTWCYVRPPVDHLDYEMDTRGVFHEHLL